MLKEYRKLVGSICGLKDQCNLEQDQLNTDPVLSSVETEQNHNPEKLKRPLIMVVGEALGREEVQKRTPFVGPTGTLLRSYIKRASKNEDFTGSFVYTNVVLCRPRHNTTPSAEVCTLCYRHAERLGQILKPDCVISAGATAIQSTHKLTSRPVMSSWNGTNDLIQMQDHWCVSINIYHPSYLYRLRHEQGGISRRLDSLYDKAIKRAIRTSNSTGW